MRLNDLITSRRPHPLIPILWRLGFDVISGEHKHSVSGSRLTAMTHSPQISATSHSRSLCPSHVTIHCGYSVSSFPRGNSGTQIPSPCGSTFPQVSASFQQVGAGRREVHMGSFCSPGLEVASSLPLRFYWLGLYHMTTPHCKRSWEM